MNTRQITAVLQKDPFTKPYFQGVFPSDQLPNKIENYPAAFVANVDPKGQPGSHWCAFYFTQDQQGEFFDSYGLKPQYYTQAFLTFIENNSREWTYNHQDLQSLTSNVCGHYCLYYVINRCRNVAMKAIVNRFSKNTRKNDNFVYYFITKYFGHLFKYLRKKLVNHQVSRVKQ
jgi:hypothetical protein